MEKDNTKAKERVIGRKAAKMAQNYVHAVIRQKIHVRGKGSGKMKPILEATKVKSKMGDYRLMGLNFTTSKVGFILNYGFMGVRNATTVYYDAAKYIQSSASRSRSSVHLRPRDLFENIYVKSGALDYLVSALSETRTEALQVKMNNLVLKFNENGRS
jgi:hypothetical protein